MRQPKVPVKRFQPSLPARGATLSHCDSYGLRQISTLAPREGSDFAARLLRYRQRHFNPRSPRGERQAVKRVQNFLHRFQPSLPARGATTRSGRSRARRRFQPSLPARGATQDGRESGTILSISTLAPREGSDRFPVSFHPRLPTFQPSLPARGATCRFDSRAVDCFLFQPSLPARGATICSLYFIWRCCYFNPRSPRGERRGKSWTQSRTYQYFNPRSPRGERRLQAESMVLANGISTLAPREGSDCALFPQTLRGYDFNPRSPRGERRPVVKIPFVVCVFQPSLPARGATACKAAI